MRLRFVPYSVIVLRLSCEDCRANIDAQFVVRPIAGSPYAVLESSDGGPHCYCGDAPNVGVLVAALLSCDPKQCAVVVKPRRVRERKAPGVKSSR